MTAKTSSILDDMVGQVLNRRQAAGAATQPQDARKPATGPSTPPTPQLTGSVAQAREVVIMAATAMRACADQMEANARQLRTEAEALLYGHDLVLSVLDAPESKPVDIVAARKRAEAEADARHAGNEAWDVAGEQAVKEIMAAAPPILTWSCPDHGQSVIKISSKGREYRTCPVPGCGEIERAK